MPNGSGAEKIERLREQSPRTEIVVITMHRSNKLAALAVRTGAIGYVLKDTADAELSDAVRHAAGGLQYRSPRAKQHQSLDASR